MEELSWDFCGFGLVVGCLNGHGEDLGEVGK